MEKKEIYVSIKPEEYKQNKVNVLSCQADILNLMKSSEDLKKIQTEKIKLKIQLQQLFSEVSEDLDLVEDMMPTSNIPKGVCGEKIIDSIKLERADWEDGGKEQSINEELREIQEKLRKLNS